MSELDLREREFNRHVWDHTKDEFQTSFDSCEPLSPDEVATLRKVAEGMRGRDDGVAAKVLQLHLLRDPEFMWRLLQLAGLTRNKIITDLKGSTRTSVVGFKIPSSAQALPSSTAWSAAGPYLAGRLRKVFDHLPLGVDALPGALEALNQATWPGFIRQERAKRGGHEAEARMARLFKACGFPFEPHDKAENPMGGDIRIHDVSFDVVVPSARDFRVGVKATVHTANIGQYGESKDHLEVDEARKMLDTQFKAGVRPVLLALVDGVGFESNRAGLRGVLEKSDEFCQFRTIWKAAVVVAGRIGKPVRLVLPSASAAEHEAFLKRHGHEGRVLVSVPTSYTGRRVVAGDATVLLD